MLEHTMLPPALQAGGVIQFSDSGIRGFYANGRGPTGPWDGRAGRIIGPELKELLSDIDRLLNVTVITDDDVEAHNRVVRSSFPADEHGPIPKVVFERGRRSRRTIDNRDFLAHQAARLLRAAGAKRVYRIDWAQAMQHVHSSMRMGHDPRDSVLDATGEARFVERLFIASNSALPNALGGPNPTLTTQALATRTAEKVFGKYFHGEPFVGRQSPVRSTDDRVTQAVLDGRCELEDQCG